MDSKIISDDRQLKISCIILAGGESRRFGSNKLIMPFGRSTVLQTVIDVFDQPAILEKIVVAGNHAQELMDRHINLHVSWIVNPNPEQEVGSSLQAGLRSMSVSADAVMIAHGDMPLIKKKTVEEMIAHYKANSIVIPVYHGRKGHPALLDRSIALKCLDSRLTFPLRQIIHEHESQIKYFNSGDEGILLDIDTPDDYTELLSK